MVFDVQAVVVFEVMGGVTEQEHVAKRRRAPVMVGVSEKVSNRFGASLPETELGIDLLDGHRPDGQPLPVSVLEQEAGRPRETLRGRARDSSARLEVRFKPVAEAFRTSGRRS